MLGALEWTSCPYLVVQALMSLGLVPDAPDSVGEDGDGLFRLRLVREDARRVRREPVEPEMSLRSRFPRDAHWRVRLSDGAQVDFGEELGPFLVSERAADKPEDFSDEEESVHRQDVSPDDSSDDAGYRVFDIESESRPGRIQTNFQISENVAFTRCSFLAFQHIFAISPARSERLLKSCHLGSQK
jgi:hypothetical protein